MKWTYLTLDLLWPASSRLQISLLVSNPVFKQITSKHLLTKGESCVWVRVVVEFSRIFRDVSLRALLRVGLLCGMCFLASVVAWGQETNGITSITGRVVDQQGGAIQDATVILLSSGALRLQQTKTDESGSFTFLSIHPASYIVEVQRSGFDRADKNVTITTGQTQAQVSIELKVAGPGQQITVTAELGPFRPDESSTATKTNIPLNEIPQGVGVANQALIQSQQVIRFADAAENISGVNRDVLAAGDVGSALTIRGLSLGVFSNYYRDSFAFTEWLLRTRQMSSASKY